MGGDMRQRNSPSISEARKYITYDPITGVLRWRARSPEMFYKSNRDADGAAKAFNAKWAGKPALNRVTEKGYFAGKVCGVCVRAHRVAWALHYGEWPEMDLDHIDGNPQNNAIANLREVTRSENSRNMKVYRTNSSGVHGVGMHSCGKWRARIAPRRGARSIHLGLFNTKEEAIAARKKAEKEHGYHENHGRA